MQSSDRLPDFLIIGAGKSGTTSLVFFMSRHPEIFVPKVKEPNFFALKGVSPDSYELEESRTYHLRSIVDLDGYHGLFAEAAPNQVLGENSNMYLMSDRAIANIKHYVPDVKLIAILRHPAERLISRYTHLVRDGNIPEGGTLEALFDRSSVWWKRPDMIEEGFYGEYLEKYLKVFKREQIKVVLFEDFKANTPEVMKDIYNFVGVSTDFEPDTEVVFNKSGKLKDNIFNKLLGQGGALIRGTKRNFPDFHKKLKSNDLIKKTLTNWRNKNLESVDLPKDIKQRITNEIYRDDIIKLEKVLGRSLSHWYNFKQESKESRV